MQKRVIGSLEDGARGMDHEILGCNVGGMALEWGRQSRMLEIALIQPSAPTHHAAPIPEE
jgi:hypothetical protein